MSTSYYNIALSSIDSNGNPCIVYPKTKASNVIMNNGSNVETKFNSIDSSISSINSNITSIQDQEGAPFIVKDICTSVLYFQTARDMSSSGSTYYNFCKNEDGDVICLTHDDIGKFIYVPNPIKQSSSMAPAITPAGFYKITKTNILTTSGSLAGKCPATFGKSGTYTGILKTGSFGNDPLYSISQLTSLVNKLNGEVNELNGEVNELNGEVVKITTDCGDNPTCSHTYTRLNALLRNKSYIRNVIYEDTGDSIQIQNGMICRDSNNSGDSPIFISFIGFDYNGGTTSPTIYYFKIESNSIDYTFGKINIG